MTWLKTDDGECMAPWVLEVGNEAYGVYQRLAGYCAQHLTDGVVPAAIAAMIAGDVDVETGISRTLGSLELVGRVERSEAARESRDWRHGRVMLPFFLTSNPSRAQVEADRETRKRRATKAASARWNGVR